MGYGLGGEMVIYNEDGEIIAEDLDMEKGYIKRDDSDNFVYHLYTEHDLKNIKINKLRELREQECFAICDRACWFYTLTDEQKEEVLVWRQAWLDVTETRAIPENPSWL